MISVASIFSSHFRPNSQSAKQHLRPLLRLLLALPLALILLSGSTLEAGAAASRIKDITSVEGIRDNLLVGYGLVVGLNGTGDSLRNSPFTKQSLEAMLERLGINTRGARLNTKNVAAVMISANLPPFSRQGNRIDITISTLGDGRLAHRERRLDRPHASDVAAHVLGDGKGRGIVLGAVDLETRGDGKLRRFEEFGRARQILEREHRPDVGLY